ncbi:recombinase family protein [Bosea sp. (in: a-proteobacteria)]|jgi:site-specific DNA recombinase|uniref:recombinase family protein n=1 Tax=Bosea sp. (in: a-proteobacteria) TaxID=1871050 RepID=UPI003F7024EC
MRESVARPQRCAIYTRKSTEHNLDLAFNSLHAQREACEAYIKSQAHEGWRLLPGLYDDGGLSGASLERPALQQLLEVVKQGGIDIIVVYKVDRLTRSLADFAKLVELFDEHGVSFVSVTQSFNTTSSMGRLTLNVLLSFAQFEREVIGERVRDKISASKQKGLWVGGPVPLGYRSESKRLLVDDNEANLVRFIFTLYRDLGSIRAVVEQLDRDGTRTRKGYRFGPGPIAAMLKNRFYLSEIVWQGQIHRGEHPAIVDRELFEAVQAQLASAAVERQGRARNSAFILAGLLYDDAGNRMSPSHTRKDGVRYRYYVSQALLQHRKARAGSVARISAPEVEAAVTAALTTGETNLRDQVVKVTLYCDRLEISLTAIETDASRPTISVPFAWQPQGRRKGIIHEPSQQRQIDPAAAGGLLTAIAKARRWMDEVIDGAIASTGAIAEREQMGERNVRKLLPLACLLPAVIRAIADGTAPAGLTVRRLTAALPHEWARQEQQLLIG